MAEVEDSENRSDPEMASLTPQSRSDDWGGTTGRPHNVIREPGSRVAHYIVLEQLGLGGMGVVYAAYDPKLDRKVALKVLRSEGHDETAAVARLRLVSEGRALARVSHPNVVAVYDVGTVQEEVYVAMELVEGTTLGQWRKARARPWTEVAEMFVQIALGLIAVHDASLVHRDVKPDNILIDREDRPKVTDFGLARPERDAPESLRQQEQRLVEADIAVERLQLTQTGARLGTPAYMACEQLNGGDASPQSDQFAFCVTLWETLYGERPFAGGSWVSLVLAVTEGQIREPPTPPSGRPVPAWLRRVLERGLSPEPRDRWPNMRELANALKAGDPQRVRRRWWMGAATLAVAGSLTAGAGWQRSQERAAAEAACEHDARKVDTVWTPQARAQLRSNYGRSKIDDAMAIEAGVESIFDTFSDAWAQERGEVCLAALDPTPVPMLERRLDCLDQGLDTLSSLVDTFSDAGDVIISRSRRTAEGLVDLERCSDLPRLERMPALPEDAEARIAVREIDRQLSQTLVHEHLGHYEEGLRRSEQSLEAARATEHQPVIAVALYRVAVFQEKLGNYEAAVEHWAASFREASLCGNDDLAAQAAGALAFAEGVQQGRTDTGIRWSEFAGILIERLDKTNTLDEARRLDTLAVLTEDRGRFDEAVALHRRSLELRESLVPPTHQSIGYGLANLAGVLQNQGKLAEAEAALLRSRSIFENAFGPDNPTTAHVLHNLAGLYREQARYDEANTLYVAVLENWSARLGPDHPDVGDVYANMRATALAQGKLKDAEAHAREAVRIRGTAQDKGEARGVAEAALNLGTILALQGRSEDAKAQFEAALADSADSVDHDDNTRGRSHLSLGWLALEHGEREAAKIQLRRAKGSFEAAPQSSPQWIARSRIALAAAESVDDQAAAETTWRSIAENEDHAVSVRAEALARIIHTQPQPDPKDSAALGNLLRVSPAEHALRIRRVLDDS